MKTKLILLTNFMVLGLFSSPFAQILDLPLAEPAVEETVPQPVATAFEIEQPTPVTEQSYSNTLPGRGMSMDQVESLFGAPTDRVERVGQPPISRWIYGNFTVYFEDDIVLHAVTHKN